MNYHFLPNKELLNLDISLSRTSWGKWRAYRKIPLMGGKGKEKFSKSSNFNLGIREIKGAVSISHKYLNLINDTVIYNFPFIRNI